MQKWTLLFPVECVQGKGNDKSAPVHVMQSHRERRFIAPLIHNLTTRWRQVVNFIHQPLYDWAEKPPVPIEQEWSGTVRKPKLFASARIEPRIIPPLAQSLWGVTYQQYMLKLQATNFLYSSKVCMTIQQT